MGDCLLAPGVYDCTTALLAQRAGFRAISISGYSVEAALLGRPDLGFTGLTDIEMVARRITESVDIPVICDADTGYGGINNVWDTVRRLESAGVAAIHIEDQTDPKKCGGLPGRSVIPVEKMVAKIQAAKSARRSTKTLIIARTDAKAAEGFASVTNRLNIYIEEGADIGFAAEAYDLTELRDLGQRITGRLAICGGVPGWSGSFATSAEYSEMGVNLVLYPFCALYVATRALQSAFARMYNENGFSADHSISAMCGFEEFGQLIGLPMWSAREQEFGQ
jgi:2-methylisocitrate lyase-like PEP mutase family enzyme